MPWGKQEGAREHAGMCSRSPGSKLGKGCQLGFSGLELLLGLLAGFFVHKILYLGNSNVSQHIIPCAIHLRRCEWVDGSSWVWMSFPFEVHQCYLILDNNCFFFLNTYLCTFSEAHTYVMSNNIIKFQQGG
jgi:hypothetical protein